MKLIIDVTPSMDVQDVECGDGTWDHGIVLGGAHGDRS